MAEPVVLPTWPLATVAILATAGRQPHAIPVSAVVRAGDDRILLGLARRRESLARLRADPAVTLAVTAAATAFSADGRARVVAEEITPRVAAVLVEVDAVHEHLRPTFAIEAGVRWRWTDDAAASGDAAVRAALEALAAG